MTKKKPMAPWLFNGQPFTSDMISDYEGFVYLITNSLNGRQYVGRKYFWSLRKVKGKSRRVRKESDWQRYYGSNAELKAEVKEKGHENFVREILSLHKLKRDVNYCEVREQWRRGVLETMMEDGETPRYYNDNIAGRHYRWLVQGVDDEGRTLLSESASPPL